MDPGVTSEVAKAGGLLAGLGVLSKPATLLIEKVAAATGVLYAPRQMIRLATAQAKVDRIKAESDDAIAELHGSVAERLIASEARKQRNADAVVAGAAHALKGDADPSQLDEDWVAALLSKCELVSDPEMQSLWARILAGQANRAGSFSKRTIEVVSYIDKRDAELFTNVCRLRWRTATFQWMPFVFDFNEDIYQNLNLTFENLTHLDSLGLIRFDAVAPLSFKKPQSGYIWDYFDHRYQIMYKLGATVNETAPVGQVSFTQAGAELAHISGATELSGFAERVLAEYDRFGYTLVEQD